jgi:hypothetical protein
MTTTDLIKILANACSYNATGKIFMRVNGKTVPLHHCIDDFIGENLERVITLVPEGEDYYGK